VTSASDHPLTPRDRFWSAYTLILIGVAALLLLPTLAMPLGQDQATFFRGGRSMLEGGLLYVDFIDVKPPLLYLIYGLGGTLFGSSAVAIRAFDLVWQLATILTLIGLLRSVHANRAWITTSVILYALLYTTLGHAPTAQAETLFALPLLGTLWMLQRPASWQRDAAIGALTAVAFLLKYPLAIIGPGAALIMALRGDGLARSVLSTFRIGLSAGVAILILCLPLLLDPRFLPALSEISTYLGVYAGRMPWDLQTLTFGLKSTAIFFGDNVSILVCAMLLFGLLRADRPVLWSSAWMFLVLSFSVAVERKFAPYHYARLYVPLVLLAAWGAVQVWPLLREQWKGADHLRRGALLGAALLAVLFTPAPRWANIARLSAASVQNPTVYDAYLTRPDMPGFDYQAIAALQADLHQRLQADDRVMVVSLMATPIVPFLPTRHVGPFADAHFYHGVGARPVWKHGAAEQMRAATVIVVDTIDQCTGMTLHPYTSWQALQREPELWKVLTTRFEPVDTVACFFIFEPKR